MSSKLIAASFVAITLGATAVQARDLTIAGWGGAFNDTLKAAYFDPFTQASGSKIAQDTYLGGLAEIKAMVEAGNLKWDLVNVEGAELQLGCDEGLYEELDWSSLGGKDILIPEAVNSCGAGAYVWGTVLSFNTESVGGKQPASWADFWDTTTWPGKRGLRTGPKGNMEFALLADGVPVAEVYSVLGTPEGVDRAFAKLDEIREHVQFWDAGAQPIEWLTAKNVVMTTAYNARPLLAAQEGRPIGFTWTNAQYSIDSWVILAGSPNKEKAMEFIAFANSVSPQSEFVKLWPYGPTNAAVVTDLAPDLAKNLPAGANIESAFMSDEEFWTDNIDQITQRWNSWVTR